MPTGLTYSSLVTDMQNYSQKGSATADATTYAEIPRIINRAEITLARELKVQGYQSSVTANFVSGTPVVQKPTDWLNNISINYNSSLVGVSRVFLFPRSYEYLRVYWPDETETDSPKFYADYGDNNWLIAPTPDAAYEFELVYYALPALLDSSNETNWLTEKAPDLLLNQCIVDLGMYLGWKADKAAPFVEKRDKIKAELTGQDLMRVVDRATTRRTS